MGGIVRFTAAQSDSSIVLYPNEDARRRSWIACHAMSARIWLIQSGEAWPLHAGERRLRTGTLAAELSARGHQVTWFTTLFEHQRKTFVADVRPDVCVRSPEGYTVMPLGARGYSRNVSLSRYRDHAHVARRFAAVAPAQPKPDLIVAAIPCHLLASAARRFATEHGIPFVLDIRDPWPDALTEHVRGRIMPTIVRVLLATDWKETAVTCEVADAVMAVSDGYLQWARRKGKRTSPSDRVFFLGYRRMSPMSLQQHPMVHAWLRQRTPGPICVFSGTFGRSYQLRLVVEAAAALAQRGRNDIGFIIAGRGEQDESLRALARPWQNVCVPGWLNAEQLQAVFAVSDIGLVPCKSVPHTVPNKPFEYMAAGLPLLSSLTGEFASIIAEAGLGLNYSEGDLPALVAAITRLADDTALRSQCAASARRYFNEHGDAALIYAEMASYLERVLYASRGASRQTAAAI